jgi:hypothetical protein
MVTPTDAKQRAVVVTPDGVSGLLVWVPPPLHERRHERRYKGCKAVVLVGGRRFRFHPDLLTRKDA